MARRIEDVLDHPIVRALDPRNRHFMRAYRLSKKVNPCFEYGLEIVAVTPFSEFGHLKIPPIFEMMCDDYEKGLYEGMHTLIIPSSGNTVGGGARLAPAFGFDRTKAVIPSDTAPIKRLVLEQTPWTEVIPAGGAGRSSTDLVEEHARMEGHYVLDQYKHPANMRAHRLYTGPEILRACGGELDIVAIAMGSGGTVGGVGQYVSVASPSTVVIGVQPVLGEQVPGTRDERRMAEVVTLPWEDHVHYVVQGSRKGAFVLMRRLASELEPAPGPSAALALLGLKLWVEGLSSAERAQLRGKKAAFVCHDQSWPYAERETGELDPGQGMVR